MAGTIFGLPLSQRVDPTGKPEIGWLIYLYTQNTSTPVNSYSDTGLSLLNPWPIQADAYGMMPSFWLPDGAYRVRATNRDASLVFFDMPSVLAIGPSAGAAPSGGVDPTTVFQTGDCMWLDMQGARSGWVRDNGRTIGSDTSGATEAHGVQCQALFTWLWTNFPQAICTVIGNPGGVRLGTANADWLANNQITLPDKRGYIIGGLDDMGNAAASRWTGAPVGTLGGVTTPGALIGEVAHTLAQGELPNVNFNVSNIQLNDNGHSHKIADYITAQASGTASGNVAESSAGGHNGSFAISTTNVTTGISIKTGTVGNPPGVQGLAASGGSGNAHNVAQRTILGTFYRKL